MRTGRNGNDFNSEDRIQYNKNKTGKNKLERKHVIKMVVWLVIAIFTIYQVYSLVMYTLGKKDKDKMWLYNSVNSVMNVFFKKADKSTTENYSLKFAGLGDIYLTSSIINSSKSGNTYDFSEGIENVKEKLNNFDVVVASLSTPVADKSLGYSNKSVYNAPTQLLDTLKELNVYAVATATDHAMDKREKGVINTINNLKEASIEQVGINESEERNKPLVISKNEINIGILSYATKSNVKIANGQKYLVNTLNEDDIKSDVEYLNSKNVDYIIAYLNDPNEDSLLTSGEQKQNVELLFNNGVNVVLGTGSMVVQGQVEDQVQVNDEKTNHIYSIYSLGDFFGSYVSDDNRSSVIANIEFTKKIKKNKKGEIIDTVVDMKVNTPIFVWTNFSSKNIKTMYIMQDEINNCNAGNSNLTSKEYNELVSANDRLKGLFK